MSFQNAFSFQDSFSIILFFCCPFGIWVVFPDGVLFLLLSVRELGCFPERSIVSVVVRSGIWLFSRTGYCFRRHSSGNWGVFPDGRCSFGITGAGRKPPPVGNLPLSGIHSVGSLPLSGVSPCREQMYAGGGRFFSGKRYFCAGFSFSGFSLFKKGNGG